MQQKNFLLFLVLSFLLFIAWMETKRRLWPPPPRPANQQSTKPPEAPPPPLIVSAIGYAANPQTLWQPGWTAATLIKAAPPRPKPTELPAQPPITPDQKLVPLETPESRDDPKFHLQVQLDPRGGSVRSVILNKFQQADDMGKPVWKDEKARKPEPLALVPPLANVENPSYLLYLYDPNRPTDNRPLDTLGKKVWEVVEVDGKKAGSDQTEDGRKRITVTFKTQLEKDRLEIFKKYTLVEGDYHIGLELSFRFKGSSKERLEVRYQLTGAHGLPIEGRWYTSVFRNALIGEEKDGALYYRDLQDLRQIDLWGGGNEVPRRKDYLIRYAGVAVQYFASMLVVDDRQPKQDFLARTRPTLEKAVYRGAVKSISEDGRTLVLIGSDNKEATFYAEDVNQFRILKPGMRIAVVYTTDSQLRSIVSWFDSENKIQPLWEDDITVRVMTEPIELKGGDTLTHRYLLYNGPVKPSLLSQQTGDARVPPAVIDRYVHVLKLNTLTDYPSTGIGRFFSAIYLTELVIFCTNLMHTVLGWLNAAIHSYGLSIILLTLLVRGLMFPISRKQALVAVRMQALMPEMKAIQEKYKDDKQAQGQAVWALYRKHQVNPFGTCWVVLLQMPIFMGLYFALQESITFRLAPFWPTWIINLSAPDMLAYWGQSIPWLSQPENYGGFFYLGPYFNLLPVIAVVLMLVQQKLMTPPAMDEQQEMQQKMMKYMMIFFGLMFYKVASGLCVYFIVSSLWGLAERKMLPKVKPQLAGPVPSTEGGLRDVVGRPAPSTSTAVTAGTSAAPSERSTDITDGRGRRGRAGRNRRRERGRVEEVQQEEPKTFLGRVGQWLRVRRKKLGDWWAEVLRQAEKK